jgi:hypothetical protein
VGLLFHSGIEFGGVGPVRGLRGEEEAGGVRSRTGAARTILFFHIISARPSKQSRMVGSTLGVYSFALIFVSARTHKRHHHHTLARELRKIDFRKNRRCWTGAS